MGPPGGEGQGVDPVKELDAFRDEVPQEGAEGGLDCLAAVGLVPPFENGVLELVRQLVDVQCGQPAICRKVGGGYAEAFGEGGADLPEEGRLAARAIGLAVDGRVDFREELGDDGARGGGVRSRRDALQNRGIAVHEMVEDAHPEAGIPRLGQNVTPLSHEEVMAVKTAFIKALSSGGVGREDIARIRQELGLAAEAADGAVDQTLGERSLKPLTRQQVREILDRYAATLNANAQPGAARIRTSDELYARVSTEVRDARKARRDTVNDSLTESRTVTANHDIQLFERLVAGDLEGLSGDDADRMAEMARQKLASAHLRRPPALPGHRQGKRDGQIPQGEERPPAGLPLQDRRRPGSCRKSQVAAPAASSRCSDQPLGARASRPQRRHVSAISPSEERLSAAPCGLQYMN